ncbi:MAG: glycosyltransferase [Micropepsaceae bacterium]
MEKRLQSVLIYRDHLLAKSEFAFLKRQYVGFEQLTRHWVGSKIVDGLKESGIDPNLIGGPGPAGLLKKTLFKQFGKVPREPNLAALNPVVVHAQFGVSGALALPLAKHLRLPLVVTFHGGDAFKEKHYQRRIIPTIFQRRWVELKDYASLFVCVSDRVRHKLVERGVSPKKLETIHIGTELPPAVGARAPKHFAFVGRFVDKKGIDVLIAAIRRLRANQVSTPFVLAGDGPLLGAMKEKADGLSNVEFTGWIGTDRLQALLRETIALVVPSVIGKGGDAEGLPSVVGEAMAMGVPVVGSDAASIGEVANGSAAVGIVRAGDVAGLAAALAKIAAAPDLWPQMGVEAAAIAQANLNAVTQSRKLERRLIAVAEASGTFKA